MTPVQIHPRSGWTAERSESVLQMIVGPLEFNGQSEKEDRSLPFLAQQLHFEPLFNIFLLLQRLKHLQHVRFESPEAPDKRLRADRPELCGDAAPQTHSSV